MGSGMPSLAGVDILLEIREGVNQEAEHIRIPFQDASKKLDPPPGGEFNFRLPRELLNVVIPR